MAAANQFDLSAPLLCGVDFVFTFVLTLFTFKLSVFRHYASWISLKKWSTVRRGWFRNSDSQGSIIEEKIFSREKSWNIALTLSNVLCMGSSICLFNAPPPASPASRFCIWMAVRGWRVADIELRSTPKTLLFLPTSGSLHLPHLEFWDHPGSERCRKMLFNLNYKYWESCWACILDFWFQRQYCRSLQDMSVPTPGYE